MKEQKWFKRLYISSLIIILIGPWLFAIPHLPQVIPELIVLIGFAGVIAAIQLNRGQKTHQGFQLMMIYMVAFIVTVGYTGVVAAFLIK